MSKLENKYYLVFLCPPSILLSVYLLFSFQEQRRSDSSTDIDMSKKSFLEKSLPGFLLRFLVTGSFSKVRGTKMAALLPFLAT